MSDEQARIQELEQIVIEKDRIIRDQAIEILALSKLHRMLDSEANAQKLKELREQLKKQYERATEQLYLFDEVETTAELGALEEMPQEEMVDVPAYTRKKARTGVSLDANTPVVDIYDDSAIENCSRCGSEMVEVGEKVYESFTRVSYTAIIRKHVKQYRCPGCEPEVGEGRITETARTESMLDGMVCDPTLLAQIIENKFNYALPLYRQAVMFSGTGLGRYTISSWLMRVGKKLFENLYPCLEKLIYSYPLVNTDETGLKVLNLKDGDGKAKGPHSRRNSWMIVRAGTDEKGRNGPVIFTFTDNRRNETMANLLKPYSGVVQTDGLAGYNNAEKLGSFTHLDCLVHARRKAVDACGKRRSGKAYELVVKYGQFFHQEGLLRDRYMAGGYETDEQYIKERKETLAPLLEDIREFCEQNRKKALEGTANYTAFNYPLERWDNLIRFLEYPFATSSNQRAENALRPFTVGRKNWLFCITETGAEVSALYYSLVESCKSMGINVQDYLTSLFLKGNSAADGDEEAWTALLPGKLDVSIGAGYRDYIMHHAVPDPNRVEPYRLRGKRV